MGNKKYNRGASLENTVANRLSNNGFAAIRAAGSGTANRDSCDVIAVNDEMILLIECKTYKVHGNNIIDYSDHKQMDSLEDSAELPGPVMEGDREVKTLLVLRQSGKFSPRYVAPFPRSYRPNGDEELLSRLYDS